LALNPSFLQRKPARGVQANPKLLCHAAALPISCLEIPSSIAFFRLTHRHAGCDRLLPHASARFRLPSSLSCRRRFFLSPPGSLASSQGRRLQCLQPPLAKPLITITSGIPQARCRARNVDASLAAPAMSQTHSWMEVPEKSRERLGVSQMLVIIRFLNSFFSASTQEVTVRSFSVSSQHRPAGHTVFSLMAQVKKPSKDLVHSR